MSGRLRPLGFGAPRCRGGLRSALSRSTGLTASSHVRSNSGPEPVAGHTPSPGVCHLGCMRRAPAPSSAPSVCPRSPSSGPVDGLVEGRGQTAEREDTENGGSLWSAVCVSADARRGRKETRLTSNAARAASVFEERPPRAHRRRPRCGGDVVSGLARRCRDNHAMPPGSSSAACVGVAAASCQALHRVTPDGRHHRRALCVLAANTHARCPAAPGAGRRT